MRHTCTRLLIAFTPMSLTNINQVSFRVSSPGPGGSIELRAGSPTGPATATAPYDLDSITFAHPAHAWTPAAAARPTTPN